MRVANYYSVTRTNYFSVKDEAQFYEIVSRLSSEGSVMAISQAFQGKTKVGFYCDCNLSGYVTDSVEEDGDNAYDLMITKLQKIIANDDAIIITEIGNEKMRYFIATATVITSSDVQVINLNDISVSTAKKMLSNQLWSTTMDY